MIPMRACLPLFRWSDRFDVQRIHYRRAASRNAHHGTRVFDAAPLGMYPANAR